MTEISIDRVQKARLRCAYCKRDPVMDSELIDCRTIRLRRDHSLVKSRLGQAKEDKHDKFGAVGCFDELLGGWFSQIQFSASAVSVKLLVAAEFNRGVWTERVFISEIKYATLNPHFWKFRIITIELLCTMCHGMFIALLVIFLDVVQCMFLLCGLLSYLKAEKHEVMLAFATIVQYAIMR